MVTLIRFALGFTLVLTSLFLILLVLIQRGRGGGLTGALGGAGGQSAFGTKAGDVFTRITVGVAAFWIGLCILSLNVLGQRESLFSGTLGGNAPQAVMPQTPAGGGQPAPGGEGIALPGQEPAAEPGKNEPAKTEDGPTSDAPAPAPAAEPAAAAPAPPAAPVPGEPAT